MSETKSPTVKFIDSISEIYKAATADTINGKKRKTLGDCLKEDFSRLKNKTMTYFTTDGSYNDNIEIPSSTKTLTGEPFSVLYGEKCSKKTVVSDKGTIEILKPETEYNTEMFCCICKADERSTYDALSERDKMVYEMTLLTKKIANEYDTNKLSALDAKNKFCEKADEYKAIAEKSNMNWQNILMDVSCELQQQSSNYRKNNDTKNLNSVNLAHNLFVTYNKGEDEYFRSAFINIDGSAYDSTLELNNSPEMSFWDKCKNGIKKASLAIHSLIYDGTTFASSGWLAMKGKITSLANGKQQSDKAETKELSEEKVETKDETKQTKDETNKQGNRAKAELSGITDSDNDSDSYDYVSEF